MVAQASSSTSQVLPSISVQEKGSRNKRKFQVDPPLDDTNKNLNGCPSNGLSAEKLEITRSHGHSGGSSESHDADWSDLTESQLEELVLSNLHTIFNSAIKKIVAYGYSEEDATKAVLSSGLCYGCKDTVSNIVDNTLAFLRNGQEIDPSRDHSFEDLQQMEKYILAELVCVLREVRPVFSTGDAMWCLLVCDMNLSHACAMDSDPLSSVLSDGAPNGTICVSAQLQSRTEPKSSELDLQNLCKLNHPIACNHNFQSETLGTSMASNPCAHNFQSDAPTITSVPNLIKPKSSLVLNGLVPEKESPHSTSDTANRSFGVVGTSQSSAPEEKLGSTRKVYGITKRECTPRQKSLTLEKHIRTYCSRGPPRAGKLVGFGSLVLDDTLKYVSDSTCVNVKYTSFKISKGMGVDMPQDNGNHNLSTHLGLPSPAPLNLETVSTISTSPKVNIPFAISTVDSPPALSAADTDLSLSLPSKGNAVPMPINSNSEAPNCNDVGMPYDQSPGQCFPQHKKDEIIMKLVPRVRELQNQLQEWTEWANQRVMQAARRLSKDKAELKTLRQEKEEVERLKKDKQTLEENTMKKLSEMENALGKASGQVERANSAVRRLQMENAALRLEMQAAKLQAVESAASCQDVSRREKKTLMKFQSWEKQKTLFQEELMAEKRKFTQLQQKLEPAKDVGDQLEARWKLEEKATAELLCQASSVRKEREEIEASAKSKEDMIKTKAESNLQRYKDGIEKLEKEISLLRLKRDSLKIAALRRGIDGSYASRQTDIRNAAPSQESQMPCISRMVTDFQYHSGTGGVKRERECVMCLSEEMSVVFLPCAHQVVCATCNELHEKQGMTDCPSCRSPIQRRICVRYAQS
ncbi:putative E3 ubiquitin-protein ligase RF298 isoform X2 [Cornus florida]|uniref:putative E3 ubiquitin-protein ligase RF298 isoform X2 n=1 Tax=Cornus florida TaxID=4283 RepID=UPI00289A0956|nr:putative E3 ubiquitin-protein ligase RF298 isoform X2 [Cornus florida]